MDYMKIKAEGKIEIEDELGRSIFIGEQRTDGLVIKIDDLIELPEIEEIHMAYEEAVQGFEADVEYFEENGEKLEKKIKELEAENEKLKDEIKYLDRLADHLGEICKPKPEAKVIKMKRKVKKWQPSESL